MYPQYNICFEQNKKIKILQFFLKIIVFAAVKNCSILHRHVIVMRSDNVQEIYEPRSEKTGLRGLRPGPTQTRLYSHGR